MLNKIYFGLFILILIVATYSAPITDAICVLQPTDTSQVTGTIIFSRVGTVTTVSAEISNLEPGKHGIHIHEFGDLSDGCTSTGGHYNPLNQTHGGTNNKTRHAGDMGNIEVDDSGVGELNLTDKLIMLNGKNSVIGRAVVIHADRDDLGLGHSSDSMKNGHSGKRIACCVIGIRNSTLAASS